MFVKSALVTVLCVQLSKAVIDGSDTNRISKQPNNMSERAGRFLHKDCDVSLSAKCLKIRALSFIEDLNSRDELPIPLLPGFSIVKENKTINSSSPEELAAELSRQFPGKPEEKLNQYLLHRLQDYLDGHSLKYRLLDPNTSEEAMNIAKGDPASTGSGRKSGGGGGGGGLGGGGGKGGGGGGMMAAAVMMKGALMSIGLGGLAMLAGKALMTAMLSLLLSAIIGIKSLTSGGKSTTYEIVSKPIYSHSHSHSTAYEDVGGGYGHSGYGRNLNVRKR